MQNSNTSSGNADSTLFVEMIRATATALEANRDTINALNVFPVPDGDTGTNMMLTLRSVLDGIGDDTSGTLGEIAQKMARSALLGARGNSGLILAQFFKGLAESLGTSNGRPSLRGESFAESLRIAATNSYKAVPNPVEGTMLTVYRDCADLAEASATKDGSFENVLSVVASGSLESVRRTPDLLPVLAEAEVVDSGGFGFAVMLDGALRALHGEGGVGRTVEVPMPAGTQFTGSVKADFVDASEEIEWGYCTVFAIENDSIDLDQLREHMDRIGRSPVVDGAEGIAKVHVHMADPGEALSAGIEYGFLSNIEIANMDEQAAGWASERRTTNSKADTPSGPNLTVVPVEKPEIAVVAVASGDGLADLIRGSGLGATSVVEGGDTMNASVAELLEAVEAAPSDQVILLPNNKNIVPAAQQVPDMTDKDVRVVPTRSVQTGIASLLAFNMDLTLDQNVEAMNQLAGEVGEGRVCHAARDVTIYGHNIKAGMAFATFDDEIIAVGRDPLYVLTKMIESHGADAEIVTIYTGESVTAAQVESMTETLGSKFGSLEIEVVYGGQPYYDYLVAVE